MLRARVLLALAGRVAEPPARRQKGGKGKGPGKEKGPGKGPRAAPVLPRRVFLVCRPPGGKGWETCGACVLEAATAGTARVEDAESRAQIDALWHLLMA